MIKQSALARNNPAVNKWAYLLKYYVRAFTKHQARSHTTVPAARKIIYTLAGSIIPQQIYGE